MSKIPHCILLNILSCLESLGQNLGWLGKELCPSATARGSGSAALPFAGIKTMLPCGFLAPKKARSHQGCDRLATDLEGYKMEGFSF